jgi:hypothetical protein
MTAVLTMLAPQASGAKVSYVANTFESPMMTAEKSLKGLRSMPHPFIVPGQFVPRQSDHCDPNMSGDTSLKND